MEKFFKLILLTFIMVSCNNEKTKNDEFNTIIKEDFLEIDLDSKTSNISRGLQSYSKNGKEFLFNVNWGQNSLQIYDIDSGELINELFFQTEGDETVGRVFGFHVESLDSIFLFSQQVSEIILIDSANTMKNRIKYETPDIFSNAFVHNAYFISTPILKENELIIKTHLQGNYRNMTDAELESKSITYSINSESGEVKMLNQKYPEDYLDEGLKFYEYSMAGNSDKLAFSFFGDHRLFYTSKTDKKELKSKEVKSKYLADELPLFPKNGEREASYEYLFASDHYEHLLYDEYRNIYYRFAVPRQEFESTEELSQLKEAPKSFSIMILDEDLNVLDELLFDDSRYVPNNVFIGKKGLYISTSHPNNPDNREDKMVFDLIDVG